MEKARMNVLLTNDDGIYAPGLWAVYRRLRHRHRVIVVAPDRERSAVGHAITLHRPLRAGRVEVNGGYRGYAVSGFPADCVKFGLLEIAAEPVDLVVAGINPGANTGVNINYSGTVSAAREACLNGVPALAVSVAGKSGADFEDVARFVEILAEKILSHRLPFGTFLNVNIPARPMGDITGVRISRQGLRLFEEYFERRVDPRERVYYWQGADRQLFEASSEIDGRALEENHITITPIKCDTTDYEMLADLRAWDIAIPVRGGTREPVSPPAAGTGNSGRREELK
jgi:5'-nucleotidase